MIALPELAALLVAFCVFLICWLLLQGYKNTLGLLLGKIADETRDIVIARIHPFGWLAGGIDRINHFILYNLGQVVASSSWAWHKLVAQIASFVSASMELVADLAEATQAELDRIVRHALPAAIIRALRPLYTLVYSLRKQLAALAVTVAHLPRVVTHAVTHEITHVVTRVEHTIQVKTKTVVVQVAGAAGIPLPRIKTLEREVRGIDELLRDTLKRVTAPVIAGIVATVAAGLGLSWARCSRANRLGRTVCGLDDGLLESLIVDTLVLASTISLVEFAHSCQSFTSEVDDALRLFVREVRDLRPIPGVDAHAALARYAAGGY